VSWKVKAWSLLEGESLGDLKTLEDVGSRFLRNASNYLADYKGQLRLRQQASCHCHVNAKFHRKRRPTVLLVTLAGISFSMTWIYPLQHVDPLLGNDRDISN
jgi:hypothetical protein